MGECNSVGRTVEAEAVVEVSDNDLFLFRLAGSKGVASKGAAEEARESGRESDAESGDSYYLSNGTGQ